MQKGVTVYQESQTFDRKTTAQAWLKRRETEMAEPGAITKASCKGVTVKEMIERCLDEYEKLCPLGKMKRAAFKEISKIWLDKHEDKGTTSQKMVDYRDDRMRCLMLRKMGAVSKSKERERRPTLK